MTAILAVLMLPGYMGSQEHLQALEKRLRGAGIKGEFLALEPFEQRPYRQAVQRITTAAQKILERHSSLLFSSISMGGMLAVHALQELIERGTNANRLKAILIDPPFGTHNVVGKWGPLVRSVGAAPGMHYVSSGTAQIAALHKTMKGFRDPGLNLEHIHLIFNQGNTLVIRSDEARRDWQHVLPGAQFWAVRDGRHDLASFETSTDCTRILKKIAASL